MASKPKIIKVNVFGQDYVIKSPAGQKYIEKVAQYVSDNMEEIRKSGIDDSQQLRIAVLAAMNITDELFSNIRNKKKFVDKLESKTLEMKKFVDGRIEAANLDEDSK